MNRTLLSLLLAVLCLDSGTSQWPAQTYRSHPPMRSLSQAVKAPLANGSKLFVNATGELVDMADVKG